MNVSYQRTLEADVRFEYRPSMSSYLHEVILEKQYSFRMKYKFPLILMRFICYLYLAVIKKTLDSNSKLFIDILRAIGRLTIVGNQRFCLNYTYFWN